MPPVAAQHDHAYVLVGRGPAPRVVEIVEERHRLGVGDLGPVERDDRDPVLDLVQNLVHPRAPSVGPGGYLGRPRMRSAMMLRWISEVPPAMVPPKLRAYRSNQLDENTSMFMWKCGAVEAG